MTKSEKTMRVVPAVVLAAAVGGVVLGAGMVTPVLADEAGGLTFRQALGANPSSIFQFARPTIVVENPAGAVDEGSKPEPGKVEAASAAAPAATYNKPAEKAAEKVPDVAAKRGSVRVIPPGTMEPGEPRVLPVPRRNGSVAVETLPGPDGELPKMASGPQSVVPVAKPAIPRDARKVAAGADAPRPEVAAKTVANGEAVKPTVKADEGAAGKKADEVALKMENVDAADGVPERGQAAADAAGASVSPPKEAEGVVKEREEAAVQGGGTVADAAATAMPSGGGARDAGGESVDAAVGSVADGSVGGAVEGLARTGVGGGAGSVAKRTMENAAANSRSTVDEDGLVIDRRQVGGDAMKGDEAGVSVPAAFLGGMSFCGILVAGVAGLVHWRRRRMAGMGGAVDSKEASAERDDDGRARTRKGGRAAGQRVSSVLPEHGRPAAVENVALHGGEKRAAVPGEGLPPARVAADLIAKDRASGQAGVGGALVPVDAARRAVARTDVMAPWHDAEHVAAIVAWAPRDAMSAA